MVEPPTVADRKLVGRFAESPDRLLRREPRTGKFADQYAAGQYALAHQA